MRTPGRCRCGWPVDDKHKMCAAHRMRVRKHGDPMWDVPVARKPSRRPEDVAARRAATAARMATALRQRAQLQNVRRERERARTVLA